MASPAARHLAAGRQLRIVIAVSPRRRIDTRRAALRTGCRSARAGQFAQGGRRAAGRGGGAIYLDRNIDTYAKFALGLSFRSEENTYELQAPMRTSYAVFCVKKKKRSDKEKE